MTPNEAICLIVGITLGAFLMFLFARRKDRRCDRSDCSQPLICPVHNRPEIRATWSKLRLPHLDEGQRIGADW